MSGFLTGAMNIGQYESLTISEPSKVALELSSEVPRVFCRFISMSVNSFIRPETPAQLSDQSEALEDRHLNKDTWTFRCLDP